MNHLDLTLPTPAENLALDEALLDWAEDGSGGESLRFWESARTFVVVGYANRVAVETSLDACTAAHVPVLRRCSGGGTVVQGPGCLNYSLVLRIDANGPTRSIAETNRFVMERNRMAIEGLMGRPVTVAGHTDLAMNGLKFSGNAQRRRKDFLIFHGTFLLNFDLRQIPVLLPMPSAQPEYRDDRAHVAFLTNLKIGADQVKTALRAAWHAMTLLDSPPDHQPLVAGKYSRDEWNQKF